ncbi:MAG: Ig-like domain-containing protein [Holophaga sp.]|nr:Ig-like domain-containing protein [Holophaga sp.]
MAILTAALAMGCQGNRDPILGGNDSAVLVPLGPQVTLTVPATTLPGPTPGAPTNASISAAFTENMNPATITGASFTLAGPGGAAVAGSVGYAHSTAVFTPNVALTALTTYTATITTAATSTSGAPLAGNQALLPASSNYVWTFRTGAGPDTTRPQVTLTVPATTDPGPTPGVATNTALSAVFSKPMNPTTLDAASFTLTGPGITAVPGAVGYASGTATFTPSAALTPGTTYTATLSIAVTDLAGNQLEGNQGTPPAASAYVWTFTAGLAGNTVRPQVTLTFPATTVPGPTGVALNAAITATFSKDMAPATLNLASFTVTTPLPGESATGSVAYSGGDRTATFTPRSPLAPNTTYTATVTTAATDVTGNQLAGNQASLPAASRYVWTFTTGSALASTSISLGAAGPFGIMATATVTNTGASVINGDVALQPGSDVTGFPPGILNGSLHVNDGTSAQAGTDLLSAYNTGKALPPGTTITGGADLGALYAGGMAPGTYTSGSTMLVSSPLVLDAGGNVDAVWVFQIGSSLTTGASMTLANGARPGNVFWVITQDATVGTGNVFYGSILAGRSVTGLTGATINGRILAGATSTSGTVALDTTTVNVPAS